MRVLRLWSLLLLGYNTVYAIDLPSTMNLTVPFYNVTFNANQVVTVNYSFGVYPTIFCYANNMPSVSTMQWQYKGKLYSGTLPVSLITNGHYQGSFADPSGTFTIQSNQSPPLIISCYYAL